MQALTKAQLEVYRFIVEYIKSSGHSPSVRDICAEFRLSSPSTAAHYVQKLQEAGYISRTPGRARTITLQQALDSMANMEPLALRDAKLEKLWGEFGDLALDPETECMEEPFLDFPVGTHREDIWHWFDERHSQGVHYLLYGDSDGVWAKSATMYNECERNNCAYNADGACRFSLVHGRKAEADDFGCSDIRL